jgi:hypothetical protein
MKPQATYELDLDDVGDAQDVAPRVRAKKGTLQSEGWAETNAPAAKEETNRKVSLSLDDSVRKADRLFASQDWNAAADAYRDLLRRFPSHKDVPKWWDRMNASTVAYQQTLEAKRKRKVSDDPLSGVKP